MPKQDSYSNLPYQVIDCQLLTKEISRVLLTPASDAAISYQAGQYIMICHPDQSISPMSVACAPQHSHLLELHLHHPDNNLQAKDLLRLIQMEKQLLIRGSYGSCTVSCLDLSRPIIFVATGTGFAPIKAIMEELINKQVLPDIYFYWGAISASELYLQTLIKDWQEKNKHFHFKEVISGSLIEQVLQDFPELSSCQIYAVDMENAIHEMLSVFMKHGLERARFFSDMLDYCGD